MKNIKAEIDKITSETELKELQKYIEERISSLKPTLHDVLDPYFKAHSKTDYFILGSYGKNEEGGVYTTDSIIDYDTTLEYDLEGNERYREDNCLNCELFEGVMIKECRKIEEAIKGTRDYPEISEINAHELYYGECMLFIYDLKENKVVIL